MKSTKVEVWLNPKQIELLDSLKGIFGSKRHNVMETILVLFYTRDLKEIMIKKLMKKLK